MKKLIKQFLRLKQEGDPPKKYQGLGCVLLIVIPFASGAFLNFFDEQSVILVMTILIIPILFYVFIWREYSEEDIDEMFSFKNTGETVTNFGYCPSCTKKISRIATKCPYCTASLK